MSNSGQKFIGRNRAPRVQIEYDLETGGAQRKVELPFVMAVMSDLKGAYDKNAGEEAEAVDDRRFVDVKAGTIDQLMKSISPRVMGRVKNRLGDDPDELSVNIAFSSMKDFSPARVVEQVPELAALMEKREQLRNLLSHMDGKPEAEELIRELLGNSALLESLASSSKKDDGDTEGN